MHSAAKWMKPEVRSIILWKWVRHWKPDVLRVDREDALVQPKRVHLWYPNHLSDVFLDAVYFLQCRNLGVQVGTEEIVVDLFHLLFHGAEILLCGAVIYDLEPLALLPVNFWLFN